MTQETIQIPETPSGFLQELRKAGADVTACYQCGRCSAGCPAADYFDVKPMQAVRLCSYGQEAALLTSRAIWVCAACETCTTRCPNGIDIARMMDLLRSRAIAEKKEGQEPGVLAFHKAFLHSIRAHGRVFEVGMIAHYKIRSGDLFSDMGLGFQMFRRNKLKLFPTRIQGTGEVKAMFRKKKRQEV